MTRAHQALFAGHIPCYRFSREEEAELARKAAGGDAASRKQLILAALRWAIKYACRIRPPLIPAEDAAALGALGAVLAVDHFQPERGRLSTVTSLYVRHCVLRAHDNDGAIRVPRSALRKRPELWRLRRHYSLDRLLYARSQRQQGCDFATSCGAVLERKVCGRSALEEDTHPCRRHSRGWLPAADPASDWARRRLAEIWEAVEDFPPRQKAVMYGRYVEGLTLRELSKRLGRCHQAIALTEQAALRRLRRYFGQPSREEPIRKRKRRQGAER